MVDIINNIPWDSAVRYAHWQQRMNDQCDALDDACASLNSAIEALNTCALPADGTTYDDALAALEDIAAGLRRDREQLLARLSQLDGIEQAALDREYRRAT